MTVGSCRGGGRSGETLTARVLSSHFCRDYDSNTSSDCTYACAIGGADGWSIIDRSPNTCANVVCADGCTDKISNVCADIESNCESNLTRSNLYPKLHAHRSPFGGSDVSSHNPSVGPPESCPNRISDVCSRRIFISH